MIHTFLTIAIPFESKHLLLVDETLETQGKSAMRSGEIRDHLRNQGVHFLSITTVPGDRKHSAFLVIESSHDGKKKDAVKCVASKLSRTLEAVFKTAEIIMPDSDMTKFLNRHSIKTGQSLFSTPGLNHRGVPGMTVERIKKEYDFANDIREILAKQPTSKTPLNTLRFVRDRFAVDKHYEDMMILKDVSFLAPEPDKKGTGSLIVKLLFRGLLTFGWPFLIIVVLICLFVFYKALQTGGLLFAFGMATLTLLAAFGVLLGGIGILYSRLRTKEEKDEPDNSMPNFDVLTKVMRFEDDGDNNHMAIISVMKPGLLRKLTLKLAFWVIGKLAPLQFKPGFLADLGTIHFARWVLLPGTNKLLFFSNYGGSWESYLEDFITKAAGGLTSVWSNTYGYPRTENLFFKGAEDGDRFKRWARRQQRPSLFWYRAYPNMTTRLIRLNAAICHGLLSASSEDEASNWLALFGSRRRKPGSIQTQEVQSIMFGGMGKLRDATCYLFRLPDDPAKARQWLTEVEPDISFGDRPPFGSAQTIAVTCSGLARFGLAETHIRAFSAPFQQGMSDSKRAEFVLKDTGDDHPEKWRWGHGVNVVDIALTIYADVNNPQYALSELSKKPLELLIKLGGKKVDQIDTRQLPAKGPVREAFGFVDGVSQPIIKGTYRWNKNKDSQHVVEPGEFILGYPDNRGYLPTTPTIPSTADPDNTLPVYHEKAIDHDWPDYSRTSANARHDFGSNGSYLVIRQLQQNVEEFDKRISQLAQKYKNHPGNPPGLSLTQLEIWIKSKTVGRWPDGTSLVRHPFEPGTGWNGKKNPSGSGVKPDNSFLFGTEDPEGMRCPFSAHIRRTNPRESFEPGSQEQLDIVNRHRILRIGRPYGPDKNSDTGDKDKRGLLFMCLNGDLERQFEFIQHTWVMSRLFHGLSGEVDAILGRGGRGGQLTIPTQQGPIIVQGFTDFITVRGGAYFFLPGHSAIRYLCSLS